MYDEFINDEYSIYHVRMKNDLLVLEVEDEYNLCFLLSDFNINHSINIYYDKPYNEVIFENKKYRGKITEILDLGLVRVCIRCGTEVVFDEDLVSDNFYCACIYCDEDLYSIETKLVPKKEVVKFITEEDKEYYREYGTIVKESELL